MMPDPLHPAVVHLPIALAVAVPAFAILTTLLIRRGFLPATSWVLVVLAQALLLGSGWLALETGEEQEDRVERYVAERPIETHEEAAERFLVVAGVGLVVIAAGLAPGRSGFLGRVAGSVAAIAVLAAGVSVGHTGGELVYRHGAASAYLDLPADAERPRRGGHDDDD